MIEPLADELATLIAAERTAPVTDAVAQAAVRAKLAIAVGKAPLGAAAAAGVAGKVLAILAVVVGAGVVTKLAFDRPPASKPVATMSTPTKTTATVPTSTPAPPVVVVAPAAETPAATRVPAPIARARAPVAVVPPVATTPTQAELLKQAWAARDATVVLELVHRDAALHPYGALAEERIVLEVRALADLHRRDEARATAAQFFIAYPNTVHRELVESALAQKDTP